MTVRVSVTPSALSGEIFAPSSKSEAHRLLICSALADGVTDLDCSTSSADVDATAECLRALGAGVARTRLGFRVKGLPRGKDGSLQARSDAKLDCGESGSTLRFLLPVVAALGCNASMTGHGRLPNRPLSPLYEELVAHGSELSPQGQMPLRVSGKLHAGTFELPGNVSSQYASGLLFAAPVLREAVEILIGYPVESKPYIDLTIAALARFGCAVDERPTDDGHALRLYVCAPEGLVSPGTVRVGGDWSGAAFWLAAGAIAGDGIRVRGLDPASAQGDMAMLSCLTLMGARVRRNSDGASSSPGHLCGRTIDMSNCPDLVPPLAAVAAVADGTTQITGAARLRLKESDRLSTVSATIIALGGSAEATDDGLLITGRDELEGGEVDAANDHRIAMMAAILAPRCRQPVTIRGADCVAKSYPAFFEDLQALGGACTKEGE